MSQIFTPEKPPKSGNALKLWRWWIQQTGKQPRYLDVVRPGRHQSAAGSASYIINNRYIVYSPKDALKQKFADAQLDRTTGDYHFD